MIVMTSNPPASKNGNAFFIHRSLMCARTQSRASAAIFFLVAVGARHRAEGDEPREENPAEATEQRGAERDIAVSEPAAARQRRRDLAPEDARRRGHQIDRQ